MIQNALVRLEPLEVAIIYVLLLIRLIPIFAVSKTNSVTERIAYASSFGNKLAFMIVAFGIFRGDWMIGCIGAFILIVGDAGMLILSLLEMRI